MDEYTDLIDPNALSKNGGLPNKIHPPHAKGSKEAKPDSSSKILDENFTTEKSSPDKGLSKKPVDNTIIDLDVPSILKKPPAGENSSPEGPDSNQLKEGEDRVTSTPVPPTLSTDRTNDNQKNVVLTARTGGLVRGSDGKMYHVHPGSPGPVGPPGEAVSTIYLFLYQSQLTTLEIG